MDELASVAGATPGRILVVDDNADMRRYIRHVLGEHWTVEAVSDGPAALQAVDRSPPELVLLDAMLPEMSGFEVLRALRSNPATRVIPVIIVSARAGEEASVEGLLAGADDYISKPFVAAELSARVATQVAAARARAAAEAAVRQRDEFVTLVVHDLRHPLASLNWHIELYRRRIARGQTQSPEQVAELVSLLEASGKSLSAQIDELHDATVLQAGSPLVLHLAPTDLVQLARAVTQQHEDGAGPCRLRFESTVGTLIGEWDAPRLERVLGNLLSNAIKYSPDGGDITVRVSQEANEAILSVQDHGMGIASTDVLRVFEPYMRGSNVKPRIAGSGLGLAAARGIVEQHGGSISVTSTEGQGSTFTVRLPLAQPVNSGPAGVVSTIKSR
jgi:signal transduction histidine kinase